MAIILLLVNPYFPHFSIHHSLVDTQQKHGLAFSNLSHLQLKFKKSDQLLNNLIVKTLLGEINNFCNGNDFKIDKLIKLL